MNYITRITVFLFVVLTAISFGLSYEALMNLAAQHGKPGLRSVFWPLLVDGGLIIFSLSVVWSSLRRESTWIQWLLVIFFTGWTIVFNYVQAPDGFVAKAVAVSAPVVLVLTFERLMSMARSGIRRKSYLASLDTLQTESKQKRAEMQQLSKTVQRLKKRESKLGNQMTNDVSTRQQKLLNILESGEDNKTKIAQQLGVARSTVYNDIGILKERGALSPNGSGRV